MFYTPILIGQYVKRIIAANNVSFFFFGDNVLFCTAVVSVEYIF